MLLWNPRGVAVHHAVLCTEHSFSSDIFLLLFPLEISLSLSSDASSLSPYKMHQGAKPTELIFREEGENKGGK